MATKGIAAGAGALVSYFLWRSLGWPLIHDNSLDASRPAAILAFPGRGAAGPYGRFADFPEFARLLDRRYAIAVEGNGYRIYARRPGA